MGALARYGLAEAIPATPGGFPWATFVTNVSGCLLMGVLVVVITELRAPHPLVRPFLGVGVLGGFTTFSTYAVETTQRPPGLAVLYAAATLMAALVAVFVGAWATRAVAR